MRPEPKMIRNLMQRFIEANKLDKRLFAAEKLNKMLIIKKTMIKIARYLLRKGFVFIEMHMQVKEIRERNTMRMLSVKKTIR